jgi:hypothetical protein
MSVTEANATSMIHRLRSSSWGVRNRGIARDRVFPGCKAHHVDGPLVASSCWGVVAYPLE